MNPLWRRHMYGYNCDEVPLPPPAEVKEGTEIKVHCQSAVNERVPVASTLPLTLEGHALPKVNFRDQLSVEQGVRKRAACQPPKANGERIARFGLFVDKWLDQNLVPLLPDTDVSFETWLNETNYPQWRKDELAAAWDAYNGSTSDYDAVVKSFVKDEGYVAWKHARLINARKDIFKCLFGPYFKQIETAVYRLGSFIKHVPVCDRPRYIQEYLGTLGGEYEASDYTAFESLFTKELMETCEFKLYEFMTKNVYGGKAFMKLCRRVLAGKNVCQTKGITYKIKATRMSGEMCTSLGNGFTNLLVMLFLAEEAGAKNVKIVVEGDDALCTMDGPRPSQDDFISLGLSVKLEHHANLETASFCGLVFDSEDLINVTDPKKVLASFGWTSKRYCFARDSRLKDLLRAKGLSMAFQYPGCPVIAALSKAILRLTSRRDIRYLANSKHMGSWERENFLRMMDYFGNHQLMEVLSKPTGMRTRCLVEDKFGLSIEDQLTLESHFDGISNFGAFQLPIDDSAFPREWAVFYDTYVIDMERTPSCPGPVWNLLGTNGERPEQHVG